MSVRFLLSWENTADHLEGIFAEWDEIPRDLRYHYADELALMIIGRPEYGVNKHFAQADAIFKRNSARIKEIINLDVEEFIP